MKKYFISGLLFVLFSFANAQVISTYAGTGFCGSLGDGGPAIAAQLCTPEAIAIDTANNIYIAEYNNRKIRKISSSGTITTIAGTGTYGHTGDGGLAVLAEITSPTSVAVDKIGNVYFGEFGYLRKVDTAGIITTIAGDGIATYSGNGILATAAEVSEIMGITFDASGNIYFTEFSSERIRKISTAGIITTIAGTGFQSFSGDGGPATSADLSLPWGIVIDGSGNILFSDKGNNRIRKINSAGTITTIAGTGATTFSAAGGPAITEGIPEPLGLFLDPSGELYFAENTANRVCKIDASNNLVVIAGNGIGGFSGDGSFATSAKICAIGVVKDAAEDIYFADNVNNRIRKVTNCLSPINVSISGATSFCGGTSNVLTASGASSYMWSANTGSATTSSVSLSPSMSTVFSVEGVNGGCIDADTVSITVNPVLSISGLTTVCVNTPQTLLTVSGATSYVWSANAGSATSDTTTVHLTSGTTYTITGTMAGCTSTDTVNVSISVPITPFLNDSVTFCNWGTPTVYAFGSATSFLWTPGGQTTRGLLVDIADTVSTQYTVTGTDAFGCVTSDSIVVTVISCPPPVGIETNYLETALDVYPNPGNGLFRIETNTQKEQKLEVYDIAGKRLFIKNITGSTTIDVTNLDNGIYVLRLTNDSQSIIRKVIINK